MKQIPDKSTPGNLQVMDAEVAVSIPDRQVTDKQALEAMKRAGNVVVTEHYLEDLETIGIYARKGTLKIQRGRAMINQRRMEIVLEKAAEIITATNIKIDSKHKPKAGEILMSPRDFSTSIQAFAQLSSKLTESQQFSVNCEEVYRPAASVQDPDQVHSSFTPGAAVKPANTQVFANEVHLHSGDAPKTAK
jgi:hypothetical protein